MEQPGGLAGAAAALGDDSDRLLQAWLDRYEQSTLRLPGRVQRDAIAQLVSPIMQCLADALSAEQTVPGGLGLRELEKDLSFLGGNLSAAGASAFDAAALVMALRDELQSVATDDAERERTARLFDWFSALTLEGFAHGCGAAATERHRDQLEDRTPVVLVAPDIPAAFPVGDAAVNGLRGVFARLVMQIARVGARVVVIDTSGLTEAAAPSIVDALREYCAHRKISGSVAMVVCGLSAAHQREWMYVARNTSVEIRFADHFGDALMMALEQSDYAMVRRSDS